LQPHLEFDEYVTTCSSTRIYTLTKVLSFVLQVKMTKKYAGEQQLWSALQNVDYKFLLIPIVFISLRIWGCIDDWILLANYQLPKWAAKAFFYISVSIKTD